MTRAILLFACLSTSMASNSVAQDEGDGAIPFVAIEGAYGFATSPSFFTDYWPNGPGGGLSVGAVLPGTNNVEVFVSYNFYKFLSNDKFSSQDISITNVFLNGRYKFTQEAIAPYALLGLGYFRLGSEGVDSESAFGGQAGLGVSFKAAAAVNVFLEGVYVMGATEEESTQFAAVKAGAIFLFR